MSMHDISGTSYGNCGLRTQIAKLTLAHPPLIFPSAFKLLIFLLIQQPHKNFIFMMQTCIQKQSHFATKVAAPLPPNSNQETNPTTQATTLVQSDTNNLPLAHEQCIEAVVSMKKWGFPLAKAKAMEMTFVDPVPAVPTTGTMAPASFMQPAPLSPAAVLPNLSSSSSPIQDPPNGLSPVIPTPTSASRKSAGGLSVLGFPTDHSMVTSFNS